MASKEKYEKHGEKRMTHLYSEINQHDALYKAVRAYPGGVEAMAQRLNISSATLYKKLRPVVNGYAINYEELSEIIEHLDSSGSPGLADLALGAFCWRHQRVVVNLPDTPPSHDNLLAHTLTVNRDQGAMFGQMLQFLESGSPPTAEQRHQIEKSLQLCITSMIMLRNSVFSKFNEG